MLWQSLIVTVVYLISFLFFKPFRGIIRSTSLHDLFLIGNSILLSLLILFVSAYVADLLFFSQSTLFTINHDILHFSHTQLFLHGMMVGIAMSGLRLLYREGFHQIFWHKKKNAIAVILFGAGNMGHNTYNLLHLGSRNRYRVVAIVDDNPQRIGKHINGMPVRSLSDLNTNLLGETGGVQELIIAIDDVDPERLRQISNVAEKLPLKIKVIPPSSKYIEGAVAAQHIRTLKIADLLGRKAINIDNPVVSGALLGKTIMVTGGAGSIGSELVRQIASSACKKLVIVDQAESALYDVQQELKYIIKSERIKPVVGDVRDAIFMEEVFKAERPDLIFHAAAYKHVPLMEDNPYEAIWTNVVGSSVIAQLADKYDVEKFVMVSTDKAVNPTNIMGATKRIAEVYVAALNSKSKTSYIVTRFGNVLGSNGSVIPLFERQIKEGGPLTITHPDITRYFMTIPEACQLVQEAAVMGKGGEVFVFDMGRPVRIMELAKKMIALKGLQYPIDIDIKIVGLRPGEKVFEELLANGENTIKTYHEKIMIAKVGTDDLSERYAQIMELCDHIKSVHAAHSKFELVSKMKAIVPEFKSQNSDFTILDNPSSVFSVEKEKHT
ncbi:polysaccharide biosynthesis protein [Sphingobacterium sp. lm-10]|uniref:polysaccharide biosynthesis protein n=1 Tax=Sphingobacterium sp. lm-10 TaxID=2944904 RepID=UPI002020630B|nr:nucleoside-diphosphate sugar epimerase/dehydratase [Sphingobacterium sp. lm-10]MCL7988637.1 polysaccharide biosynthesis protein [Sphingobacterium sp. lm-10]